MSLLPSARLKSVVDPERPITYGIVQCGPDVAPLGVPYVRPVDMVDEGVAESTILRRTSQEIAAPYSRSIIRPGDLVVSIGPSFGKVMVVPRELDGANLTQGTARVAPGPDVDGRFLFWVLRSRPVQAAWEASCNGATFRALTLWGLGHAPVPILPVPRQRAIADFLDRKTAAIDALIEKKERLLTLLAEKRAAVIHQAVTKGLDPNVPMKDSGIPWIGEIPAHWEVMRLRWTCAFTKGGVWGSEPDGMTDLPCIRVADFDRQRSTARIAEPTMRSIAHSERRQRILKPGDLLLEKSGGGEKSPVGFVVRYLGGADAVCSNFVTRVVVARGFDSSFVAFLHRSMYAARVNLASVKQTTGIQNLDVGAYFDESVAVPPSMEQAAIGRRCDEVVALNLAASATITRQVELLREYRQALITAAVTGQLDIEEAA